MNILKLVVLCVFRNNIEHLSLSGDKDSMYIESFLGGQSYQPVVLFFAVSEKIQYKAEYLISINIYCCSVPYGYVINLNVSTFLSLIEKQKSKLRN